jgi:hypothetical protein
MPSGTTASVVRSGTYSSVLSHDGREGAFKTAQGGGDGGLAMFLYPCRLTSASGGR